MNDFQAVVMAAGRGSRMSELLHHPSGVHKCTLPIGNIPMLFYPLRSLKNAGFSEALVILPPNTKIEDSLSERLDMKLNAVNLPKDSDEFGTAESLRAVKEHLKQHKNLLVISSDLITDIDLSEIVVKHRAWDSLLTVLLAPLPTVLRESVPPGSKGRYKPERDIIALDLESQHMLMFSAEADYEENVPVRQNLLMQYPRLNIFTNLLDCHCYAFKGSVLNILEQRPEMTTLKGELVPYLTKMQSRLGTGNVGEKCYAIRSEGWCVRANNLTSYAVANRELQNVFPDLFASGPENITVGKLQTGSKCLVKKSIIGERCNIGNSCKVTGCIIMNDVTIEDGCVINNSILCSGAVIKSNSQLNNCVVCHKNCLPAKSSHTNEILGLLMEI